MPAPKGLSATLAGVTMLGITACTAPKLGNNAITQEGHKQPVPATTYRKILNKTGDDLYRSQFEVCTSSNVLLVGEATYAISETPPSPNAPDATVLNTVRALEDHLAQEFANVSLATSSNSVALIMSYNGIQISHDQENIIPIINFKPGGTCHIA